MKNTLIINSRNLFYQNGYFKTKITDITESSNISTGNFYRFYSSKEDVLIAVIRHELKLYSEEIKSIETSNQDFKWKINQIVHTFLIFFKENHDFFVLLHKLEQNKDKFSKKVKKYIDSVWVEPKITFINSLKKSAKVRDKDLFLAEHFFESQLKIYTESLFEERGFCLNPSLLTSTNFKEITDKLLCILTGICDSLSIPTTSDKYDPVTNAYTKEYTQTKLKELANENIHFSITRISFEFLDNTSKYSSSFFKESILRYFVSLVKKEFRTTDIIGRLSHNEFIFIAPASSIDVFSVRSESIKEKLITKFPSFKREYLNFVSTHISDSKKNLIDIEDFNTSLQFRIKKTPIAHIDYFHKNPENNFKEPILSSATFF